MDYSISQMSLSNVIFVCPISPVVSINDKETAGVIEILLRENNINCFPVVDVSTKEYVGLIRRYVRIQRVLIKCCKYDCI